MKIEKIGLGNVPLPQQLELDQVVRVLDGERFQDERVSRENMTRLAPSPAPSISTITRLKPGDRSSVRNEYRKIKALR